LREAVGDRKGKQTTIRTRQTAVVRKDTEPFKEFMDNEGFRR
jgi:hypothetical protein